MSRHGLSIPAKLTLGTIVPVAISAALGCGLAISEIARLHAQERALVDELVALESAAAARSSVVAGPAGNALAEAATERAVARIAGVGALCALAGGAVAWAQGRDFARRLRGLAERSDAFVAGRPVEAISTRPSDELGALAHSLDFMTDHLATMVQRARERGKLLAELEVAQAIQLALLPASAEVERAGFQLAGALRPTAQCGGDVWSHYALDEDRTLVVIGGASGHSVDAVLVAAAAKAACDAVRTARGGAVSLSEVLEAMNAAVFQQSRRRLVMTCFASIVDARCRTVVHANAGHLFPYLLRGNGEEGEFRSLTSRGNKLGEVREARYETTETALEAGDTLIWYTSGALECENQVGEPLGDKRFRAAIRRAVGGNAAVARDSVLGECLQFYGAIPPKDDITMVIGRVT